MAEIQVVVVGLPKAMAALSPEQIGQKLVVGFGLAGQALASAGRTIIRPHHYTGRYEQQIHVETTGATPATIQTFVGVSAGLVPEARPLDLGWRSASGKQPPVAAIAEWIAHKPELAQAAGSSSVSRSSSGFVRRTGTIATVSGEAAIRSMAFVIARKIGQRGYSFGALHTWTEAIAAVRGRLPGLIVAGFHRSTP